MPVTARSRHTSATALLAALLTGLSALMVVTAPPSAAAAPDNDHLANATEVGLAAGAGTTLDLTTAEADQGGRRAHAVRLDQEHGVGGVHRRSTTQLLTAETSAATTQMDTVLAAYTATTPGTYPLTTPAVACDDDTTRAALPDHVPGRRPAPPTTSRSATTAAAAQPGDPGPGPVDLVLSAAAAVPERLREHARPTSARPPARSPSTPRTPPIARPTRPARTPPTAASGTPSRPTSPARSGSTRPARARTAPDTLLYAFSATGPTTLADALEYNDDVDEDNDDYRSRHHGRRRARPDLPHPRRHPGRPRRVHPVVGAGLAPSRAPSTTTSRTRPCSAHRGSLGRADEDLDRASAEPRDPDLPGTSGGFSLWYQLDRACGRHLRVRRPRRRGRAPRHGARRLRERRRRRAGRTRRLQRRRRRRPTSAPAWCSRRRRARPTRCWSTAGRPGSAGRSP